MTRTPAGGEPAPSRSPAKPWSAEAVHGVAPGVAGAAAERAAGSTLDRVVAATSVLLGLLLLAALGRRLCCEARGRRAAQRRPAPPQALGGSNGSLPDPAPPVTPRPAVADRRRRSGPRHAVGSARSRRVGAAIRRPYDWPLMSFYITTPIYYVNSTPAHRPRVHDDRGRRRGAPSPAARRGDLLPHGHRRERHEDRAGRRGGRARPAQLRRPDGRRLAGAPGAGERLERLLHPHDRRRAPGGRRGLRPADLRRRGDLRGHVPRASTASPARRSTPRASSSTDAVPQHGTVPEYFEEKNYFFRLSALPGALLRALRREPGVRASSHPLQRGPPLHRAGSRGHLDQPGRTAVGHPGAVGPEPGHLRLGRRAHQLRQRARLRGRRARTSGRGCGRTFAISSRRTSSSSTA